MVRSNLFLLLFCEPRFIDTFIIFRDYLTKAVPTILQDGSIAISNATYTVLLKTDRTELFTLPNLDTPIDYQHLIPYQDTLLLRPDTSYNAGLISVLDLTNNVSNAH